MSLYKASAVLALSVVALSAAAVAIPAVAADVTADRLLKANSETGNWLMVHRTYDSHRYSPLDEINKDTVKDLQLSFMTTLGIPSGGGRYATAQNEGTPLAEDGYLYIQSGWSVVTKVDVRDGHWGKIVWRYEPDMDRTYISDAACCGAENRGIGLWKDQVIGLTMDGRAFSLNKDTGELTWERQITDRSRAETFTVAPLIVGDTAIIGPAGGEYGIRGWIEAINLTDGSTKWRTYTIPGPGEPGNETWEGKDWETGGGSIWQTGSYDPETKLIYYGTGNPAPQFDAEYRPGDNLYTDSLVALDADTGKLTWHFQFTPNDPFDYDEVGDNQLVDVTVNGETRKLLVRAARNGNVYGLDRGSGEFVFGQKYVEMLNWTDGLDPKTGLPTSYDPKSQVQTYNGVAARRGGGAEVMCPGLVGGKNWQPAAFSEISKLLYVSSTEGCQNTMVAEEAPNPTITGGTFNVATAAGWRGRGVAPVDKQPPLPEGAKELKSSLVAIDAATGATVKKLLMEVKPNGLLATAGNLVFGSDKAGFLTAYDPTSLDVVWQQNVGTALYGPPMTYAVNGKQFVAVLAGGAGSGSDPAVQNFQPTDAVFVFSLPGSVPSAATK
ncbi:pyrroloquinoline quinone-dependent dehydrogenase [Paradevosia shaoguanensis]|uniref:PQQ-binding-like beta-propeller repeat protein n=1 Tax=Paradevosia shaoguanensis TaxID=1335043 RepID=A0AA41QNT1_9HYPH|nr:PQQ-binding-like beta-propeller repeat protein [Paradevosia shaoguanensis]MCF1742756.1 PQQ-binding-like beta-propeller repeat protein [Paradevosia shaoguanensis]MCI0127239.1 PQQ-binding-like beta-propeller repeat protein [Paradevosia shaoguanensis]